MKFASDVAFSESVKRFQTERGSRQSYARLERQRGGFESFEGAIGALERRVAYLEGFSRAPRSRSRKNRLESTQRRASGGLRR